MTHNFYQTFLVKGKTPTIYLNLLIVEGQKMMQMFHRFWQPAMKLMVLLAMFTQSDCYDPLDPEGNITVTFDIYQRMDDAYLAKITIENYYQYRQVDKPGWKLGWVWANDEVIWSMSGAFATDKGNCSSYTFETPHSCKKNPVIAELGPDAAPENRSEHCCHGGLLSAGAVDPFKSFTSFDLKVGRLGNNSLGQAPNNLTFMDGYSCGPFLDTSPTVSLDLGGQRKIPAMRTWKSECTYSSFLANKTPLCCVSLSTFYNPTITSCPVCSCGCKEADKNTGFCIRSGDALSESNKVGDDDILQCTAHMCPIQVHWHFKNNYMDHWRVKLTISNHNYKRNYSNWNVLVQHPGFRQSATSYSFNNTILPTDGPQDGVALFWGIDYYNTELVHSDVDSVGFVTTEILLEKDANTFTLNNGWALPRRIYFNGENCEMPLPDNFPMSPNGSNSNLKLTHHHYFIIFFINLILTTLAIWV